MNYLSPDKMVSDDDWSDLRQYRALPEIDIDAMHQYRMARLKAQIKEHDVALLILVNPISLRYAINFRSYGIFNTHIPCAYLFLSAEAPFLIHGSLDPVVEPKNRRLGRHIAHFYGGDELKHYAKSLADDVEKYLVEIGETNRRIAVEYVNPSITQALEQRGFEVIDGVVLSENARKIKSAEEVECMRWSIAVAELGAQKVKQALQPGVTEAQLWGLLNYTNLANDGDWHEGRMLASGPRINPWLQEASRRKVESGDMVGFDTDMVGPFGYCADLSRTFHCGPAKPSARQKELYQLAHAEVHANLKLIKAGVRFSELRDQAFEIPEEYREHSYPCFIHGVGMCDEYPHLEQPFRTQLDFDGQLEAGMTICIESFMGAVGERDGAKLEQQILVTETGYELLTQFPFEEDLLA